MITNSTDAGPTQQVQTNVGLLQAACSRCAAAIAAKPNSRCDPAQAHAMERSFERSANVVMTRFGEGEEVLAATIAAVEYLACVTADEVTPEAAIAWFSAGVGLLLELALPSARISEAAVPILDLLKTGVAKAKDDFLADAPRRAAERTAADALRAAEEGKALARLVEGERIAVEQKQRSAPLVPRPVVLRNNGARPHWTPSATFTGEWKDPGRKDQVIAAKQHLRPGTPTFIVHSDGKGFEYQCILRWGSGPLAAKVMSGKKPTDGEAFAEAFSQFCNSPDEPAKPDKPWLWHVQETLRVNFPKAPNVSTVEMVNVVNLGVPKFVCRIIWNLSNGETVRKASTHRETQAAACEDAILRAKEYLQTVQVPVKRTFPERIADARLYKGTLRWLSSPSGEPNCQINWSRLDGKVLNAGSGARPTREEAFSEALAKAIAKDAAQSIDWKAAIKRAVAQSGVPADHIAVNFKESEGDGGQKLYSCCVSWGVMDAYMYQSPALPSLQAASVSAIHGIEEAQAKIAATRKVVTLANHANVSHTLPTIKTRDDIHATFDLLKQMKPKWILERQGLLNNANRSSRETERMRDLSAYLAVLDPVRRNELERHAAERLMGSMLKEATSAATQNLGQVNTKDDLAFMQMLASGKFLTAGDQLSMSGAFGDLARSKGRTPEAVVDQLIARKLISRKEGDRLVLAEAGFKMLVKYANTTANRPPGGSISESNAAMLSRAKTKNVSY